MDSRQLRSLRAQAHSLKPIVITGQAGITPAVLAAIDQALNDHELIKVRVNAENRQSRSVMIRQICLELDSELIQVLGHIATLYRQNPDR